MCISLSLSLYIYIYIGVSSISGFTHASISLALYLPGLRTNGVNTNGAAAKVINNFDRLGKKVRPGTSGKIHVS